MDLEWLEILTSPAMWIIAFIVVGNSVIETLLMYRISSKTASKIGLKPEMITKTIKTAIISALGPSMSSFIGLIVLVAALGGAVAYIREGAGIGSIMFEFMIAGSAANAAGATLSREGMNMTAAATVMWGMALGCMPWIITGGVGARWLPKLKDSFLSKQPKMVALVSTTAMIGMFGKFGIDYGVVPLKTGNYATPIAFFAGAIAGFAWIRLADYLKKPGMKQYLMLVTIFFGMIVGQLVFNLTAK